MAAGTQARDGASPSAPSRHHGMATATHAPSGSAPTAVAATPTPCRRRRPAGPRSDTDAVTSSTRAAPAMRRLTGSVVIREALARRDESMRAPTRGFCPEAEATGAGPPAAGRTSARPVMADGASAPSARRIVGARSVSWT